RRRRLHGEYRRTADLRPIETGKVSAEPQVCQDVELLAFRRPEAVDERGMEGAVQCGRAGGIHLVKIHPGRGAAVPDCYGAVRRVGVVAVDREDARCHAEIDAARVRQVGIDRAGPGERSPLELYLGTGGIERAGTQEGAAGTLRVTARAAQRERA